MKRLQCPPAIGILCIGVLLVCTCPVKAEELKNPVVSSGGAINLTDQSGTYKVHDIKGQPAAGQMTGNNIILFIGGLFGLIGEEKIDPEKGTIEVTVTNASNQNAPFAGVKITIYNTPFSKVGYTDNNGLCRLKNIDPGSYYVQAYYPGYVTNYNNGAPIEVKKSEITSLKVSLTKGCPSPPGTLGLMIAKIAGTSDIEIAWTVGSDPGQLPTGKTADIYMLKGVLGEGVFTNKFNTDQWKPIVINNVVQSGYSNDFTIDLANNRLIYKNQVGTGNIESYFKGLVNGTLPDDPNLWKTDKTNFRVAPAVGKLNVTLNGSDTEEQKNLVCLPFVPSNGDLSIKNVLGQGASTTWAEGDMIQYKDGYSPSYQTAIYQNNQWVSKDKKSDIIDPVTGDKKPVPPSFDFDIRCGYIIIVKSPIKVFTAVGQVLYDPVIFDNPAVDILIKGSPELDKGVEGKTLIGMVYPKSVKLTDLDLPGAGASVNDMFQYKQGAAGQAYETGELKTDGWKNKDKGNGALDPSPNVATLKLPNAYVYVRKQATDIILKIKLID